jgi:hypothetical protein
MILLKGVFLYIHWRSGTSFRKLFGQSQNLIKLLNILGEVVASAIEIEIDKQGGLIPAFSEKMRINTNVVVSDSWKA